MAGFPCQAFSVAGLRKGFEDTRGTLFFDVARIAKKHKPKLIFLENVKGFKNHDKGKTLRVVQETLEGLGYQVFYEILNARNFGLPQNRERIYIVAFLKDKFNEISFDFSELKKINIESRLGNILEKNIDEKYTISDKLWEGHKRRKAMHEEKGNGFGYSIFNEDSKYTSTMSARYYKDGSEILINQKIKTRGNLLLENLQDFKVFPKIF